MVSTGPCPDWTVLGCELLDLRTKPVAADHAAGFIRFPRKDLIKLECGKWRFIENSLHTAGEH
jgi:hypothetical protein